MDGKTVKLHYFDLEARGEVVRLILHYNKVQFEDIRYPFAEWADHKKTGKFPFGQLPSLEIGDKVYAQSMAIARYLCQKFNQYPWDLNEAYQVEATKDYIGDMVKKFLPYYPEKDEEKKKVIHEKYLTETLPQMLPGLNSLLKENTTGSGFFVCKNRTLADFVVCDFAQRMFFHPDRIQMVQPALDANPELKQYLKTRIDADFDDYFTKRKPSLG